jgi:hypothetical protein
LALLISISVVSFVFFSIHESGEQFLLGFGKKGIITFLSLFPWSALVLDVLLLLFLQWILQGFRFGHRFSLLSLFLGVFLFSSVLGGAVALTPFHAMLLEQADHGELPVVGEFHDADDSTPEVILPSEHPNIAIGDGVYILGTLQDGVIRARNIHKLPSLSKNKK